MWFRRLAIGVVTAVGLVPLVSARELTFDDRVAAQKAIEQVYWNHRVWPADNPGPKPPLSEVLSDDAIRSRVESYLIESNALDALWHRPITSADLQGELDRMAANSRDPLLLHELFDALGNDAQLIAETLGRQTLASNLVRGEYRRAPGQTEGFEVWWKKTSRALSPNIRERSVAYSLPQIAPSIASGGGPAPLVATAPAARYGHTTVWTGNAMIVWGGEPTNNTGGIYDPPTDTWTVTSTGAGVPDARSQHSAVWTGSEMIVWGGLTAGGETNTGGRYVPAIDTWTSTSTGAGCPSARKFHTAVWTGARMVVWGGSAGPVFTNTGASYDPTTDVWTATSTGAGLPTVRARHTAIWTGTQMIVWGGTDSVGRLNTGARYTPSTDSWLATSLTGVPVARYRHSVVWTGTQMIVWGGFGTTYLATGGRYTPSINGWSATAGGPSARADHSAIWNGSEMIVWGGQGPTVPLDNGSRYSTATNAWTAIAAGAGSPSARTAQGAVWTGQQMVVWGGNSGSGALDNGGAYTLAGGAWAPTSGAAPVIRFQPRAWAGYLGGSATFTVKGGGNGPLEYQWRKDGVNIPLGAGVSGTTSDTLVLTGLDAGDVGAYSVVVKNGVSSATSTDAALTVGSPHGGDVDPGFHRAAMFDSSVQSVIAQADGKTLVFGSFAASHGAARGGITRLNPDGSTDLTFMAGMAGANGAINAAMQQADGRILIGGSFTTINGVQRNRIARIHPDGSLDTSFQQGMKGVRGNVYAVALQPDGKVLIGGAFNVINGENIFLDRHNGIARLNPDGSTDTSFVHGFESGFDHFFQPSNGAAAIVVLPDGKILVGGSFYEVNLAPRIGLARLNADGTTDSTFLNGMSGPDNAVYRVTLQPDGRILLEGRFYLLNGVPTNGFGRLNPDGSLDPSFQTFNWLWPFYVCPIVLEPDGKILMGMYDEVKDDGRVVRFNSDGTVDPSFQDGLLSPYPISGLSLRSDGKVVVGGEIQPVPGGDRERVVLLNSDGSLDPTLKNPRAGIDGSVYAVAIQADGRAIVGGSFTEVDGVARNSIARVHADGSLDVSFQNGMAGVSGDVYDVELQPDGRVLIGGWFDAVNGIARDSIARLNADGTLDPTFQTVSSGGVRAIALQPDGRVLIGGDFTQINGVARGHVARLNADGSLDMSFQNVGIGSNVVVIALAPGGAGQIYVGGTFGAYRLNADGSRDFDFFFTGGGISDLHTLAVQPDGRVITARWTSLPPLGDDLGVIIKRLNPDSSQDATFATCIVIPENENNLNPPLPLRKIVVQPDGRVLLGGAFVNVAGAPRANIARLNTDGTLDTSFGDTMAGTTGPVWDIGLLPDGRILAAGALGGANFVASGGVVRLYGSAPIAPAISTPPSNQVSHDGSCAVFHVTATGTPLDYQWRHGGVDLVDGPNVNGAHAATLTLTGVSAGDVGDYDCVVTNVLGEATTVAASLSLAAIPPCKIATCDPVLGSVLVDVPAPAEVASVQLQGQVSTALSWIDLGGGALYDVASSTLADLRSGGIAGASCLANDVSGAGYLDTQPSPSPGNAYYYIVRGQSVCGAGGYGTDSEGVPRVPVAACP